MISLPGLWLLCRGLWPEAVAKATLDCDRGLIQSMLISLPLTALVVIIAGALSKTVGAASIGILSIYVIYASVGISGLATSIGQKLPSPGDSERPWQCTRRGAIILVLSYLLPFIGWFVILPASVLIGSGTVTRNLIKGLKGIKGKASPVQAA